MSQQTDSNHIAFYFDPISPYAWLASKQLDNIQQKTGKTIIARPILFAGLLKAHGNLGPAEIPAKRHYIFTDVMRRAKSLEITVAGPPAHPFNPLLGLRACTALTDDAQRLLAGCALCDAAWHKGVDITLAENVHEIIASCGLDADWVIEQTHDSAIKQALIDNTRAAVAAGIFGVPTFKMDDQIFWGEDRIADLISYSHGQRIDEAQLQTILSRKSAANRKR